MASQRVGAWWVGEMVSLILDLLPGSLLLLMSMGGRQEPAIAKHLPYHFYTCLAT